MNIIQNNENLKLAVTISAIAGSSYILLKGLHYLLKTPYRRAINNRTLDKIPEEHIIKQKFTIKKIENIVEENGGFDMIVIGSGMGGLTVAAVAARHGRKVLVLEQHDRAGGTTHVFTEHGYEWDTGLHYIGGRPNDPSTQSYRLFNYLMEAPLDWAKMEEDFDVVVRDPFLKTNNYEESKNSQDIERFYMHEDFKVLKERLITKFPNEKDAINKYFKLINNVELPMILNSSLKVLPKFFQRLLQPIVNKFFFKHAARSTYDVLHELTDNKELIGILTYFYGDFGVVPRESSFLLQALLQTHWEGGAWYPVGGPSVLARGIVPTIEKAGGKVLVQAPVEKILIDEKGNAEGVLCKDVEIRAPIVVSAVGFYNTFNRLLPSPSNKLPQFYNDYHKQVNNFFQQKGIRHSCAMITVFVGLKGDITELDLPNQNFWIFPSWDHDNNMLKFREDKENGPAAIFISFPSTKDPSWSERSPGKSVALVIGPAEYEWFEKWENEEIKKRGDDYEEYKKSFQDLYLEVLLRHFPQLSNKIDYVETGSPLSNNFYLGSQRGEVYGIEHSPERFEKGQNLLLPKSNINGLYLSGQDILTDGITGAMFSGLLCAMRMSPDMLLGGLSVLS